MRNSAFLALAAAGAFASVNAFAQGPVYSVNIVGFQKVTPSNQFTQVSNPFVQTNFTLDTVIGDQLAGAPDIDSADNVHYWNGTTYVRFFKADGIGDPNVDGHWFDEGLSPATQTFSPGTGFWIKRNSSVTNTFVMVGDVQSAATQSVTINPGFSMISYPYSTSVGINDAAFINLASGATGATDIDTADNIYVWTGTEYVRYFLVNGVGDPNFDGKWVN